MIPLPPRLTRTAPLVPYTALFRSLPDLGAIEPQGEREMGEDVMHRSRFRPVGHRRRSFARLSLVIPSSGWKAEHPAQHPLGRTADEQNVARSEEHTSELQSLMRNSTAVFCLKQKK